MNKSSNTRECKCKCHFAIARMTPCEECTCQYKGWKKKFETKPSQQEYQGCQCKYPKSIPIGGMFKCTKCRRYIALSQPPKSSDLTNAKTAINKSASKSGKLINKQEKADLTVESSVWEHATLKNPCYCICHREGDEDECSSCKIATQSVKLALSQQQKEVDERVRREMLEKLDVLFPHGYFSEEVGSHRQSLRGVREKEYLRQMTKEESKLLEAVLTSIEEKGGRG